MKKKYIFVKRAPSDKIWWVANSDELGAHEFSFDKKKIYRIFGDYPKNLTKEQLAIFNAENPFWARFFTN